MMIATTVCKFVLSFYDYGPEIDAVLRDYVYIDTSMSVWGDFFCYNTERERTHQKCSVLSVSTVIESLIFLRERLVAGTDRGELLIDTGGMSRPIYRHNKFQQIRTPSGCPCLTAIMDYLDYGDMVDLMAAVDMMTDACKFDPESE